MVGIWVLLPGFVGRSRIWWLVALGIQFWHHIEHALLQGQAIAGHNLFGSPVPISIVQLWIPRLELHLLYNTLVFVPMLVAMYYHLLPSGSEASAMRCRCALRMSAPAAPYRHASPALTRCSLSNTATFPRFEENLTAALTAAGVAHPVRPGNHRRTAEAAGPQEFRAMRPGAQ